MALKILTKGSEEAQAGLDRSSGKDTLRDVLADMAKAGPTLTFFQAVIAALDPANAIILPFPVLITGLHLWAGDWGNTTDLIVIVNDGNTAFATVTVPHTTTNETGVSTPLAIEVPADTPIVISVDTPPTAGADLIATVTMQPIDVAA